MSTISRRIVGRLENMNEKSVTVATKHYSATSSSSSQESGFNSEGTVDIQEAGTAMLETSGLEHEQNLYNAKLLKQSPLLANGQVKQIADSSNDSTHDQSWFRVHSDVFKDKFYWNQYEKTDLTYSKLSPFYNKEISPGVPIMPNLSRRPLRTVSVASFTPQRGVYHSSSEFSSNMNSHSTYREQRATGGYGFDGYSDDEGDFIRRRRAVDVREQRSVSVITRLYNFVLTVFTTIYTSITQFTSALLNRRSVVYGNVHRGYHTPQDRQQQHVSSVRWGQWIYRLLYLQLLTDSWLLQYVSSWTRATTRGATGRWNTSRWLFAIFFLLPIALLAGWLAVGTHPVLSSKPAELLSMLAQIDIQRSQKEDVILQVASSSEASEKEYLDMKSYMSSLSEQVKALKDQITKQHLEMKAQQAKMQFMEKKVGRLSVNLEQPKSTDSGMDSTLHDIQMSLQSVTSKVHRLSRCCDRAPLIPAAVIQGHVINFLREIFSSGGEDTHSDIHAWLNTMFVARDELEARLANMSSAIQGNVSEELSRSANVIMELVAERIIQSKLDQHRSAFEATVSSNIPVMDTTGLTYAQVKQIVQEALSIYDADKTGLVDYALESSGGTILSTRCTENFNTQSATLYMFNVHWLPWIHVGTSPRMAIQPHMSPGECWAFAGAQGFLVIQLSREVYVTGFTLEHIPKSLSPYGHIDSAPEKFSVWGLKHENDEDPLLLGKYIYMQNSSSLQYFKVQQEETRPFRIVELKVISNHGHPNYTCIYRFRVHGTPAQK